MTLHILRSKDQLNGMLLDEKKFNGWELKSSLEGPGKIPETLISGKRGRA